jgi:hypothetical protein
VIERYGLRADPRLDPAGEVEAQGATRETHTPAQAAQASAQEGRQGAGGPATRELAA